jgi:hypothetical protein
LELPRISLCQGSPYGMILAEVVTHRILLVFWGSHTLEYTMGQPLKRLWQNGLEELSGSEKAIYGSIPPHKLHCAANACL